MNLYYFKSLFLYNPECKNIDIYYNEYDLEEDPRLIYLSIDQSFHRIQKYYQDIEDHIFYLQNCIQKKLKIDISEFVNRIISIYPFISLGQLAGHYDNITPRVRKLFQNFRFSYDNIIYDACNYLMQQIKKQLPKKYLKYIDFLLLEETIQQKLPAIEVLEDRKKGYILFDQLYVTTNYQEWFMKNYIMIKEEEIDNKEYIKGQIAYPGNVEGKVCKILSEEDFSKFEDGDILVTPMTVPKFVILIKKCSAIVTDEGGITCHASIIARELKIPCIVGCKNATKILNDHDRIEINGSTGYIKIRH